MTFDDFMRSRLQPLLRFATVLCIDAGLAEDVVQEVLIRAHGRWKQIGELERPESYIRRMIVNEFISWRRKWSRVVPIADLPEVDVVPDPALLHAEQDALLPRLVGLPPRQRAVIVLRYYLGLSDAEIASELGCGVSSVRSNASRALATLRIRLTDSSYAPAKKG